MWLLRLGLVAGACVAIGVGLHDLSAGRFADAAAAAILGIGWFSLIWLSSSPERR